MALKPPVDQFPGSATPAAWASDSQRRSSELRLLTPSGSAPASANALSGADASVSDRSTVRVVPQTSLGQRKSGRKQTPASPLANESSIAKRIQRMMDRRRPAPATSTTQPAKKAVTKQVETEQLATSQPTPPPTPAAKPTQAPVANSGYGLMGSRAPAQNSAPSSLTLLPKPTPPVPHAPLVQPAVRTPSPAKVAKAPSPKAPEGSLPWSRPNRYQALAADISKSQAESPQATLVEPKEQTATLIVDAPPAEPAAGEKSEEKSDVTVAGAFKLSRLPSPKPSQPEQSAPVFLGTPALKIEEAVAATPSPKAPSPVVTPYPDRTKIFFRPAVVDVNHNGEPVLRPSVRLASQTSVVVDGVMPMEPDVVVPEEWSAPIVEGPYEQYASAPCGDCGDCVGCQQAASCQPRLGPFQELMCRIRAHLNGPCSPQPGIGTERVVHAISFVDTTQPLNNFRFRFDAGYNWELPDRSEYFWKKIGAGGPERPASTVDYQDVRMYLEVGGDKFSVGTDIPIRIVEPNNPFVPADDGSGGFGDMTITTKAVFLDGKKWQLSNLLRTYIPSGDASAGLGTGHASLEPGFAWRYKWSDITYLHGDIKLWIPLGADPLHGGEVLSYGIAMSHVWYDSDSFAVMPTLEVVGYTFLDGQYTPAFGPAGGEGIEVDSDGIVNIHPGVRWVWDRGSDCGLQELGIFSGFGASSNHLYEDLLRVEFRWSF